MANPQKNDEFYRFGIIMIIIAILTLLNFIWTILVLFFPFRYPLDLIVSIIITISIAVLFILLCVIIIIAGKKHNNPDLIAFSPKFIAGTIIKVVGDQLFVLTANYIHWLYRFHIGVTLFYWRASFILPQFIFLLILSITHVILGSIIRYKAWKNLEDFFYSTPLIHPNISDNGRAGASNCKIANIFDALFLSIFWFVASILRIVGYFKLISLRNSNKLPVQPAYQPPVTRPAPIFMSSSVAIKYCPKCGSSVKPGARFCIECGSRLQ